MSPDFFLFQKINGLAGQSYWFDRFNVFFAGEAEYILVFCLILLLIKDFRKNLSVIAKGLIAGFIARFGLVELIRYFFPRPRPFIENHVNLLIDKIGQPAFPSGHAAFFFAFSAVVYFYNKKAGILFFILSVLVSFSRVFVGVHWPADIVAGALVGIFVGWLIAKFPFKRYFGKKYV